MTFQKALNSGKDFKRPNHKDWLFVGKDGIIYWDRDDGTTSMAGFSKESINADDWIVKNDR